MPAKITETAYITRLVSGGALSDWLWQQSRRQWLEMCQRELRRFQDPANLQTSSFWQTEGTALLEFLQTIQSGAPGDGLPSDAQSNSYSESLSSGDCHSRPAAGAKHGSIKRIVHWNILKGIRFEALAQALENDPRLCEADLLLLNEVDVGMARSGNRHVAAELGARLNRYWAFIPSYLELTKGIGTDLDAPRENEIGLHGVAILSRAEPVALAAMGLPEAFDAFSFHEKRFGRRTALFAQLMDSETRAETKTTPGEKTENALIAATVHLEVRGHPAGRARQVGALINGLDRFLGELKAGDSVNTRQLISGDFNSHSFPRGNLWYCCQAFITLLLTPSHSLDQRLMKPWIGNHEPFFSVLREAGFEWEKLNLYRPTAWAPLQTIEEGDLFADRFRKIIKGLLERNKRGIPLHLDWFASREGGVSGKRISESATPLLLDDLLDGDAPSDHTPIVLDLS